MPLGAGRKLDFDGGDGLSRRRFISPFVNRGHRRVDEDRMPANDFDGRHLAARSDRDLQPDRSADVEFTRDRRPCGLDSGLEFASSFLGDARKRDGKTKNQQDHETLWDALKCKSPVHGAYLSMGRLARFDGLLKQNLVGLTLQEYPEARNI